MFVIDFKVNDHDVKYIQTIQIKFKIIWYVNTIYEWFKNKIFMYTRNELEDKYILKQIFIP